MMHQPGTDPLDDETPDPFSFEDVTMLTLVVTVAACLVVLVGLGLHGAEHELFCLWKAGSA